MIRPQSSSRVRTSRQRLALERLEDRCTPAGLTGLGTAGGFAVLSVNGGSLAVTGSTLTGNIGLGPRADGTFQNSTVTGVLDLAPTAHTAAKNGKNHFNVSQGLVTVSLRRPRPTPTRRPPPTRRAPTRSLQAVNSSLTFTGAGGVNVIDVKSVNMNRKTLTFNGGTADVFVVNVARDFTFAHSQIVLTGGVTANHVLFNFVHAGSVVNISNGSGVRGTFLAPHGTINVTGVAALHGELVGKNVTVHNDDAVTAAGFVVPVAGGKLSGFVYWDNNYSHVRDSGESGESGVTITLSGVDAQGHSVTLTTVTGSDGSYSFTGLAAGTYQLIEQPDPIYLLGTNAVGSVNGAADGTLVGSDTIGNIVLAAKDVGTEYDFAILPPPV